MESFSPFVGVVAALDQHSNSNPCRREKLDKNNTNNNSIMYFNVHMHESVHEYIQKNAFFDPLTQGYENISLRI